MCINFVHCWPRVLSYPVASLVRGMGGDGHGSEAACHGSLVEIRCYLRFVWIATQYDCGNNGSLLEILLHVLQSFRKCFDSNVG